ncbi:MAG: cobalt-precorrin-5B (C(1))-methyltransferase CbiD, partial [bacterium]
FARAEKLAQGIRLEAGEGIGRVTKPGLDQAVGEAAINSVPRKMILAAAEAVCSETGYDGGLKITLSVPGGAEIAKKTFNPQLGIEGGISILGTSGIVEPMSEQAIVDTIALEIRQAAASGSEALILTPGNYGMAFLQEKLPQLQEIPSAKCSNFIGDAIDIAVTEGFSEVLLVGHVGKLVKLAGGIMNTHSRFADCRVELFAAHAAICGAGRDICRKIMAASTTDACIELLKCESAELYEEVMHSLLVAMEEHLVRRVAGAYKVGAVMFSNAHGLLGMTEEARQMLERWGTTEL